jgi:hypothetical protein
MRRVLAIVVLVTSAIMLPTSRASAQCWYNGWVWNCSPDLGPLGLLALPVIAVGTAVTGVIALVTLPVRAIVAPPYYPPPPPVYYPPRFYYPPPPGSPSALQAH